MSLILECCFPWWSPTLLLIMFQLCFFKICTFLMMDYSFDYLRCKGKAVIHLLLGELPILFSDQVDFYVKYVFTMEQNTGEIVEWLVFLSLHQNHEGIFLHSSPWDPDRDNGRKSHSHVSSPWEWLNGAHSASSNFLRQLVVIPQMPKISGSFCFTGPPVLPK